MSREGNPDMVNEWTRDDLPAVMDLVKASVDAVATDPSGGAYAALDAVVDHLNEHHPKPDAQADAEWLDRALNTPDEQLVALDEARIEANIQRNRAVRERDVFAHRLENQSETIAEMQGVIKGLHRAHEIVEQERDQARDSLRSLRGAHSRLTRDYRHLSDRAEAAEARTAVTREDVEKVVHGSGGGFFDSRLDAITDAVCALFGVEAEQTADPVEELAGQIESATREAIRQVCVDLADVVPSLDPLAVERAMEVTAASRKVAAHVLLGQEAGQ